MIANLLGDQVTLRWLLSMTVDPVAWHVIDAAQKRLIHPQPLHYVLSLTYTLWAYSRDVVVKGMAVIGVNVMQAPATTLLELDVQSPPMYQARAIVQAAQHQQQCPMDHNRTTRRSCKRLATSEDTTRTLHPRKDCMDRA